MTNQTKSTTFAASGNMATAVITILLGLAASAADHSITIDGVVIDLGGPSAKNVNQLAATIAGTSFALGTSFLADGPYTVLNNGAVLTFSRDNPGIAGNVGLTTADPNYTATGGGVATLAAITFAGGTADIPWLNQTKH